MDTRQRISTNEPFCFEMELNKRGKQWEDPLINYLDKHCAMVLTDLKDLGLFNNMPTLYSYLVDLHEEFLTCNVRYTRPLDFSINYYRMEGKEAIHVGYQRESIIITEIKKS